MNVMHTPGPWVICVQDDDEREFTVFPESMLTADDAIRAEDWDRCVAMAGLDHPEFEANARLIAAAPELLEALKSARQTVDTLRRCLHYGNERSRGNQVCIKQLAEMDVVITKATGGQA